MKIEAHKSTGTLFYNGIDRIEPLLSYSTDNVVPCCKKCNRIKWDMEEFEFYSHIKRVFEFLEKSGRMDILDMMNSFKGITND